MSIKGKGIILKLWFIRSVILIFNFGILLCLYFKVNVPPSIIGYAIALFTGLFVAPLTKWSSSGWETSAPIRTDGGEPVNLLSKPENVPGPFILGLLEVSVFYASLCSEAWAIIGGWFVFKAASKWAAWQHIMRVPESLKELDSISYLSYRYKRSSMLLSAFLIGSIANVGSSFVGFVIHRMLCDC